MKTETTSRLYYLPPPTAEKTKETLIEFKSKNSLAVRYDLPNEVWAHLIRFLPLSDRQSLAETSVDLRNSVQDLASRITKKMENKLNFADFGIVTDDDLVYYLKKLSDVQINSIKKLDFSEFTGGLYSPKLVTLLAKITHLEEIDLLKSSRTALHVGFAGNMNKLLNFSQVHTINTNRREDVRIFGRNTHVKSLLLVDPKMTYDDLNNIAENFRALQSISLLGIKGEAFPSLTVRQGILLSRMRTLETINVSHRLLERDTLSGLVELPLLHNLTVSHVDDHQLAHISRCMQLQHLTIVGFDPQILSQESLQSFIDSHADCVVKLE